MAMQTLPLDPNGTSQFEMSGPAGRVQLSAQVYDGGPPTSGTQCPGNVIYAGTVTADAPAGGSYSATLLLKAGPATGTITTQYEDLGAPYWLHFASQVGPMGQILSGSPKLNLDPATRRAIVFYPSNPQYRDGVSSQIWLVDHADAVGGDPLWSQLDATGEIPTVNAKAAVAYAAGTNQLYVYGGCTANCAPALSTVWVLSNANGNGGPAVWSTISVANPEPRSGHEMAYDTSTNSLLSFGGNLAEFGTDFNDFRSLQAINPASWAEIETQGVLPGARSESFAMTYDEGSSRLLVFGGNHLISTCCPYDISQYNDVQILSHANSEGGPPAWQEVHPSGPAPRPRAGASAVFDPKRQRLLVMSGSVWSNEDQSSTPLADLWELALGTGDTGASWTELLPAGETPPPMAGHAAAFSQNDRMIVVAPGDVSASTPPDLWVLAE